jgi:hypothetical protein
VKLATFKSGGQEKVASCTGDTLLFDLAAAASRRRSANPAFRIDDGIDRRGEAALETGDESVRQHGKDESLSNQTAERDSRASSGAAADARRHVVSAAHPAAPRGQLKLARAQE